MDGFHTRLGSNLDPPQLLSVLRVVHYLAHRDIPELWAQLIAQAVEDSRESSSQLAWCAGVERRRPLFSARLYHTQGAHLSAVLRLGELLCPLLSSKGMRHLVVPPNSLQCTGRTEACLHPRSAPRKFFGAPFRLVWPLCDFWVCGSSCRSVAARRCTQ